MKPRVGVFGLSGCWGEQIVILNCEDQLMALVGALDFVDFPGASSVVDATGPLDIAFVEGSVGSAREESSLRRIRERARLVVACGTCACAGGVAAGLSGWQRQAALSAVYGDMAGTYDTAPQRPIADFVKVDAMLPGCPMEKDEFLAAVAALLNGDPPQPVLYPVCAECRIREQDCLLLNDRAHCAGPVTAGGCGARCPGFGVPCIGCRGLADDANLASLEAILTSGGASTEDVRRRLRLFTGEAAK